MIKDICHSIFKYKKVGLNMKERKIYVCDFAIHRIMRNQKQKNVKAIIKNVKRL